jgi:hypothetical protein
VEDLAAGTGGGGIANVHPGEWEPTLARSNELAVARAAALGGAGAVLFGSWRSDCCGSVVPGPL